MRGKVNAIAFAVLAVNALVWAGGMCETHSIDSIILEEERTVSVYLPEGYDTAGGEGLPVVYWHSHGDSCWPETLEPKVEAMIGEGLIDPFIVVFFENQCVPFPDDPVMGLRTFWSLFLDTPATGDHRGYVIDELIPWVDQTFNTIPERSHRFITGHSLNAYGPWRMALERPDLFSKISGMQGFYEWSFVWDRYQSVVAEAQAAGESPPYQYAVQNGYFSFMLHAFSAILLPSDNGPPWYDFPLDDEGQPIEGLWQRMFDQDIAAIIDRVPDSARMLDLYFGVEQQDDTAPGQAENLADMLGEHAIPFVVHSYQGGHGGTDFVLNRIPVHLTHFMPIKATAEVSPRIADPRLYPGLLRLVVELPGDLDVVDIDCSTLTLIDIDGGRLPSPIGCVDDCEISDINGNGRSDLSAWLPSDRMMRSATATGAKAGDTVELTIRGELADGRFFQATDTATLANVPLDASEIE